MTDSATVSRIAARFAVSPIVSVRPFGGGHINETFLVETATSDHVVQRINTAVFRAPNQLADNVAAVTTHLRGRFLPEPVPARSGGWLVHEGDDVWRAWFRVADAEARVVADRASAGSAANLLARFHVGLADLEPGILHETLPNFHDPGRRLARLREVVTVDPCGRVAGVEPEIAATLAAAPLAGLSEQIVAAVPCRIAHNDPKLDNFLFRDDEAACLVDLDTVMPSRVVLGCR